MRRHAKASTAGSTKRQAAGLGRIFRGAFTTRDVPGEVEGSGALSLGPATHSSLRPLLALAGLAAAALLLFSAPAGAAVVTERPLLFTFGGSDATLGPLQQPYRIAIDNSTGSVYVSEKEVPGPSAVSKFNSNGVATNFSATGTSSLGGAFGSLFSNRVGVAVDNSGGANQGRLLVDQLGNQRVYAFAPSGTPLWSFVPPGQPQDIAVDATGHPWLSLGIQYANTGSPPAQIFSLGASGGAIDIDANGNVYLGPGTIRKYVGGVFSSNLDTNANDVYADQSSPSGHIFTVHTGNFSEFTSGGALVGTSGNGAVDSGQGIAYNPSADRVYVADEGLHEVDVFGAPVTGTVPDPAIEATTAIGIGKAEFHGTVNPQSVPNGYYFEWKIGTGSDWRNVSRSPLQTLPEDSSSHAVSFMATNLRGNQTYQVRLVAANTEKGLHAASGPNQFKTLKATESPAVTIAAASAVTTSSAHLSGTINPKEDSVIWRVQKSTDPVCTTGFVNEKEQFLPGGGVSTPLPVEFDLEGLLPHQHYCVRISATNSFGTTSSLTTEFETEAIVPDELETAFVAPRLDTSARLNGRINPQGAPLTYHFEYSDDGGANWIVLPDREYTGGAREQVVVADELSGLSPDTTYEYRFVAENDAGPSAPQGEEKSFTTRTSAEVAPPGRGIELVNSLDKGNQNVHTLIEQETSPMTEDGEKVIWNVTAGAPGGNSGAGATFLAERTSSGWHSRGLTPPADEQIGGAEEGGYQLQATTPAFSHFIFVAGAGVLGGRTLVRVDSNGSQTFLQEYEKEAVGSRVDMTGDGAHVLFVNQDEPGQLDDLGSGTPEVVSLMPDGLSNECGLESSDVNNSFVGGGNAAQAAAVQWRPGYHMIATTDASRVYFQAKPNGSPSCGSALYGIYVRNRETEETTLIDPGAEGKSSQFIRATPNGRAAYFLTYSNFDPADANSDADVYRWDEEAGESTCLTCVVPDANVRFKEGGDVSSGSGKVLVSDDFSHVYFESTSQLVPGKGKAGDLNVYVLSNGSIRFVADPNAGGGVLGSLTEISTSGSALLFTTSPLASAHQELTADRLAPECHKPGEESTDLCEELFRYDDGNGSLECLSCRHDGITTRDVGSPAAVAGESFQMSADGSTVAFATEEGLVPLDVNHEVDIYEWRNGAVRLVSDGVSSFPTGILVSPGVHAVNADGRDILFSLVDPDLTGFEQDGFANLYDARIGGGFEPPSPPVHCSEESCQGPLQVPPAAGRPASSTFSGAGNLKSGSNPRRPCAKKRGKARRRCVRKHKRHSQKARANHNAGRAK